MIRKLLEIYKIPLFVSILVGAAVLAFEVARDPLTIVLIILGAFLGTFLLDMEYIITAVFVDKDSEFSQNLNAFIKHRDIGNILVYAHYHTAELKEKVLNSAVFQIVLAGAVFFVIAYNGNHFMKAFVMSAYANSIYKYAEAYLQNQTDSWFWALKEKPDKRASLIYGLVAIAALIYAFRLL